MTLEDGLDLGAGVRQPEHRIEGAALEQLVETLDLRGRQGARGQPQRAQPSDQALGPRVVGGEKQERQRRCV